MKQRTNGRSPDRADAFFGCIEIARRRHGLTSLVKAARRTALPSNAPKNPMSVRHAHLVAAVTDTKGRAKFTDLITKSLSADRGWADQSFH
jgi:hypothetical protein